MKSSIDPFKKEKQAKVQEAPMGLKREEQRKTQRRRLTVWLEMFEHVHNAVTVHMYTYNDVHGLGLQSHVVPKTPCKGYAMRKNFRKTFSK